MLKNDTLGKRFQIDKANKQVVVVLVISAFVTTFCLVSSKSLLARRSYQSRVITEKSKAAKTLKANVASANTLASSYKVFVSTPDNVLGGVSSGNGDNDGDNAKIILDALPSKYDFPALATSLEKIMTDKQFKITSITGSDDELAQDKVTSSTPKPVEMPFQLGLTGSYDSMNVLFDVLGRSIRPFQITQLSMTGTTGSITLALSAKTYYQPEKNLNIVTKVVK